MRLCGLLMAQMNSLSHHHHQPQQSYPDQHESACTRLGRGCKCSRAGSKWEKGGCVQGRTASIRSQLTHARTEVERTNDYRTEGVGVAGRKSQIHVCRIGRTTNPSREVTIEREIKVTSEKPHKRTADYRRCNRANGGEK